MAIFYHTKPEDTEGIYNIIKKWKTDCLLKGGSLLWPKDQVWSKENLLAFKACFIDDRDESNNSFEEKLERQLSGQHKRVYQLATELVLIYLLYPSNITLHKKKNILNKIAGWKDNPIEYTTEINRALQNGIGGTGIAYNTRRPFEIKLIGLFALELLSKDLEKRKSELYNHKAIQEILENLQSEGQMQGRHILLHLLFPERYERIASKGHKRHIYQIFQDMIGDSDEEDLDELIYQIRQKLEKILSVKKLDFYRSPLREVWYSDNDVDDLTPEQGLEIKKQIVFYGPPGTGKTYGAVSLAERFIRKHLLTEWGPKRFFTETEKVERVIEERIRRVQFHPGYGYEDFIRGLQIVEGGQTAYKNGVLLQIIEMMEKDPDNKNIPYVLILDEMNRADISKVFGECFSLLENRDQKIQLAGASDEPTYLSIPSNIYFIGTMNLIDQSLEQVDFALRRRFLWYFEGYSTNDFLKLVKYNWNKASEGKKRWKPWERVEDEFIDLASRCEKLNQAISNHYYLGENYQIGHTYFADIVPFVERTLLGEKQVQTVLFYKNSKAREPMRALWNFSIYPLIEQYLSGIDLQQRKKFIQELEQLFLG
ncbi:McrB family protein [Neobacillus mesonae]|uniref:McrB family protein n=1 Tax=Neobacillus mesonae TaxID=1193713 RepID=UPI00082F78F3|nr:AAA family ATPase [Neobacillus mesonae]